MGFDELRYQQPKSIWRDLRVSSIFLSTLRMKIITTQQELEKTLSEMKIPINFYEDTWKDLDALTII